MPLQLDVQPVAATLGATVSGIDLREPLTEEARDAIYQTLLEHKVLFFRGQHLSDDQHLDLARSFGEPFTFPVSRLLGGEPGQLGYIKDDADSPPQADDWHTDITWIEEPPKMAFLAAMDIPPIGGDTMWANTVAAYEALSPQMQAFCSSLSVKHRVSENIIDAFRRLGDDFIQQVRTTFPGVSHPLVRTHPDTGENALFVASTFMVGVEGFSPAEKKMLFDFLLAHVSNPNFHVRWKWEVGDLVIWTSAAPTIVRWPTIIRKIGRCVVARSTATCRTSQPLEDLRHLAQV